MANNSIVVLREDTGGMVEQANFIGGRWAVYWTTEAVKAKRFPPEKAEEIVQWLGTQGLDAVAV